MGAVGPFLRESRTHPRHNFPLTHRYPPACLEMRPSLVPFVKTDLLVTQTNLIFRMTNKFRRRQGRSPVSCRYKAHSAGPGGAQWHWPTTRLAPLSSSSSRCPPFHHRFVACTLTSHQRLEPRRPARLSHGGPLRGAHCCRCLPLPLHHDVLSRLPHGRMRLLGLPAGCRRPLLRLRRVRLLSRAVRVMDGHGLRGGRCIGDTSQDSSVPALHGLDGFSLQEYCDEPAPCDST